MSAARSSLLAEACFRFAAQVAFAASLLLTFQSTKRTLDLGIVSVAMLVPSLAFTWGAGSHIQRFGAKTMLIWAATARGVTVALLPVATGHLAGLAGLAGVAGVFQLCLSTAKLRLDGALIDEADRTRFNSRRALLGSLATILGPTLVGMAAGHAVECLTGAAALTLVGAFLSRGLPAPAVPEVVVEAHKSWRWWRDGGEIGPLVFAYVTVLAVLEMEVPLVFPWLEAGYGRAAERAGPLFGACGFGAMAGAALLHRRNRPVSARTMATLLVVDGAVLLLATTGVPLKGLFPLFAVLGIISTVTMVSVESTVQRLVAPEHQAGIFAWMAMAGGTGGAALTLVTTAAADAVGAGRTLAICAAAEILIGIGTTTLLWVRLHGQPGPVRHSGV